MLNHSIFPKTNPSRLKYFHWSRICRMLEHFITSFTAVSFITICFAFRRSSLLCFPTPTSPLDLSGVHHHSVCVTLPWQTQLLWLCVCEITLIYLALLCKVTYKRGALWSMQCFIALNEFGTTCWWRKGLDMFLGGILNTGCSTLRTQTMIHGYVSIVMYNMFS